MSIPKVIHYCWFGGSEMPALAEKCIKSWKKFCPDYEIICWNEENFDIGENRYAREAYEAKKWAFVSDYARLRVTFEHGGIYLDTDVELIKPIDELISENGFMGFEESGNVATGLGFACEKGNEVVHALLKDYEDIPFVLPNGEFDLTPCPDRNTKTLRDLGLDTTRKNTVFGGIRFLSEEYLCPINYYTGKKRITEKTHAIHHYSASWTSAKTKRTMFIKRIVGPKMYDRLYGKFLHKLNWLEW